MFHKNMDRQIDTVNKYVRFYFLCHMFYLNFTSNFTFDFIAILILNSILGGGGGRGATLIFTFIIFGYQY